MTPTDASARSWARDARVALGGAIVAVCLTHLTLVPAGLASRSDVSDAAAAAIGFAACLVFMRYDGRHRAGSRVE